LKRYNLVLKKKDGRKEENESESKKEEFQENPLENSGVKNNNDETKLPQQFL
jgi:hypothetical protein